MLMKSLLAAVCLSLLSTLSLAQTAASAPAAPGASCEQQAAAKKLAGAAKNSFIKKCDKTAAADQTKSACDAKAAEKKLAGAAKNSFIKKCNADATHAAPAPTGSKG